MIRDGRDYGRDAGDDRYPCCCQLTNCLHAAKGVGRARFEGTGDLGIKCGDGDHHRDKAIARHLCQKIEVT